MRSYYLQPQFSRSSSVHFERQAYLFERFLHVSFSKVSNHFYTSVSRLKLRLILGRSLPNIGGLPEDSVRRRGPAAVVRLGLTCSSSEGLCR